MTEPHVEPASVLVVEDDPITANLVKFLLERENYAVHVAADGHAALDFIKQHPPTSLVLMDVLLPFMDGYELLRKLRAYARWSTTPVIMISAKSQGSEIARGLDAGADDYITKPIKPEELFARIRRHHPARRGAA